MSAALTWVKSGEWGIEGVDLSKLPPKVYGALCKLRDLEHPISATVADHIRALDDRALSAFLVSFQEAPPVYCQDRPACDADVEQGREIPKERCVDCLLYWLQDPYMGGPLL